jgi:hypothetical protein
LRHDLIRYRQDFIRVIDTFLAGFGPDWLFGEFSAFTLCNAVTDSDAIDRRTGLD